MICWSGSRFHFTFPFFWKFWLEIS